MKKNLKDKTYIKELINKYPKITSGRKNINSYNLRIVKTIELIKRYFNKN